MTRSPVWKVIVTGLLSLCALSLTVLKLTFHLNWANAPRRRWEQKEDDGWGARRMRSHAPVQREARSLWHHRGAPTRDASLKSARAETLGGSVYCADIATAT